MDTLVKKVYVYGSGVTAPDGATIDTQIWDINASTYIQDGSIVITDPFGNVLNSGSTVPETIVIRHRQGDTVYQTGQIKPSDVKYYKASPHRPAMEQTTFVGYNGTDGTFTSTLTSGASYITTIWREDSTLYMGVDRPKSAVYVQGSNPLLAPLSLAGVSEAELVLGTADIIYKDFIRTITGYSSVDIPIKVEVVTAGTNGTKTALATTIAVSNESSYFVLGGAPTATCVAGAILSIAGKLYVIKDIDLVANTGNLLVPYQGTSATVASGTSATTAFVYAPASGANLNTDKFGLQITGVVKTYKTGLFRYEKTRFQVQVSSDITGQIRSYGVASVAINTKGLTTTGAGVNAAGVLIPNITAYEGIGRFEQASDMEWEYKGEHDTEKQYRISVDRSYNRVLVATSNGTACTYSVVNIEWQSQYRNNPVSVINDSGNVVIFVPVTYSVGAATMTETKATAATYGFVTTLDAMLTPLAAQATALKTY